MNHSEEVLVNALRYYGENCETIPDYGYLGQPSPLDLADEFEAGQLKVVVITRGRCSLPGRAS